MSAATKIVLSTLSKVLSAHQLIMVAVPPVARSKVPTSSVMEQRNANKIPFVMVPVCPVQLVLTNLMELFALGDFAMQGIVSLSVNSLV